MEIVNESKLQFSKPLSGLHKGIFVGFPKYPLGYMDILGNLVLSPKYSYASTFQNGIALVKELEEIKYINHRGENVFNKLFTSATTFKDGYAIVSTENQQEIIDEKGVVRYTNPEKLFNAGNGMFAVGDNGFQILSVENENLIPIKFENISQFSKGYAAVSIGGLWGVINFDGDIVIEPRFASLQTHENGIFSVQMKPDGPFGLITSSGDWVTDEQFLGVFGAGSDFLFVQKLTNPLLDIIDRTGQFVGNEVIHNALQFTQGLAAIETNYESEDHGLVKMWGFVDDLGKIVIEPEWMNATPFINGISIVEHFDGTASIIDLNGEQVSKFDYLPISRPHVLADPISWLEEGIFVCDFTQSDSSSPRKFLVNDHETFLNTVQYSDFGSVESHLQKAVNSNGTFYLDEFFNVKLGPYSLGSDFKLGRAWVQIDEKFFLISTDGKLLSDLDFEDVWIVDSIPTPVKFNGKWGFFGDESFALEPQFDEVIWFSEGLAGVKIGELWGFIDYAGQMMISPQFHEVGLFSEGLCPVRITGKNRTLLTKVYKNELKTDRWGYIDRFGNFSVEPVYLEVGDFRSGLAAVRKNENGQNRFGYINQIGQIQIPHIFLKADEFNSQGFARVQTESGWAILAKDGKYLTVTNLDNVFLSEGATAIVEIGDYAAVATIK